MESECNMAVDISKELKGILEKMELVEASQVPDIDLYMDQVTTFMESHLGKLKRNPDDKVLTKTMINNYAKNELLPAPEKKKYSKNHVLLLTFIYYFKNVLSIGDITTLMKGITEEHFQKGNNPSLEKIYSEIVKFQPEISRMVEKDLDEKTKLANTIFEEEQDSDYLQLFSLLSLLSFDVYLKKQLIETVIDEIGAKTQQSEPKKESKKENKEAKK